MQKTMAWAFAGRLTIVVHGPKSPTAHEWERFLTETIARRAQAWDGDARRAARGAVARVLVVSYGGVPDGDQRKKLTDTLGRTAAPTVVMTDSALMSGVSRVLAFFNPSQKTVPLDAQTEALDFLGLSADERATVRQLRSKLESELELRTAPISDGRDSLLPGGPRKVSQAAAAEANPSSQTEATSATDLPLSARR